jgi:heterogeneous nuclear ribonucleoprotein K
LPLQVAGAIIGKGGSRIRQLRSQSQADISIEGTPSGSDRKISIKGRQDQVKNAYLLLQKR